MHGFRVQQKAALGAILGKRRQIFEIVQINGSIDLNNVVPEIALM
jgi:hypothetical protein